MAEKEIEKCFVCDNLLLEDVVEVKVKGIETFRKSSQTRNDGKVAFLKNKTCVSVHDACRKTYNNARSIDAYVRRGGSEARASLRSQAPVFPFNTHCFLCANEITAEFLRKQKKLEINKRDNVFTVTKCSVKDTVLKLAKTRGDAFSKEIEQRLKQVPNLVSVKARYHNSCMKKFQAPTGRTSIRGVPPSSQVDEAMEFIFSYLEENSETCQFRLQDLMDGIKCEYHPKADTVKNRLVKKYGDDIIFAYIGSNSSPIVCFRDTGYKILTDAWYTQRKCNEQEERKRVVEEAAAIVLEDIRSQTHDLSCYPPTDNFLKDVETVIPESLSIFLNKVILTKKRGDIDKYKIKCTSIAHAIMSASRPRSFLSPIQIGLATFLNRKFASKILIQIISNFGFCSTYKEAMRFEMSAIMRPQVSIDEGAFSQFVFDNADFNTQTLDGLNTFHSMGGIQCVTPITAVLPDSNIERLTSMPTAQDVEDIGYIPLLRFERKGESGLKDVKINNVEHLNPVSSVIVPSATDLLWMYGKWSEESFMPGWNGFMEQATIEEPYTRSKILCLPFINAPPSDHDTILTSLMYAAKKCEKLKQHTCFVTFDQPLFLKARDIVSTLGPEYNIVVRLGGFHLLMSFMGCIGHVMAGSGLKELLMTIYAPNSLDKMLKGHAYARALRAHILTHLVLSKIVFQNIEFTAEERAEMSIILDDIDRTNVLIAESNTSFETVAEKFKQQLMQLESNGPTAKLWIQYLRMVTLVKQFVEAERMGNWKLHLATIQKMLPFFHACGHFNYAKSAHLYLQDMLQLCEKMTQDEYDRFTNKGFFTIRRTNKFWSGTWSDMCIEQELMRPIKVAGGMTERGKTSSVSTKWTMGAVYLQNVCDEIEKFCRVYFASTEQHVDMRSSRVTRDNGDAAKLFEWLSQHPPFPEIDEIMSLSSGIVGDGTINCYMAQEIGAKSMEKIINNDFHSVKFKRKDNVLPLSSVTTSVRINDVITPIQPLTIFQRMCIAKQSNEELQHYMEYELAPFPMALFNEEGMRKTPKSSLYKVFSQCADDINVENTTYVIDGGYLIHRVVWHRNQPFSSIFSSYVSFVKSHYKDNAIIVFDGYPQDNRGTKSAERNRRTTKKTCADILFDETTIPTVSQESLLANENNKRRFVTMLKQTFQDNNFIVHQATEDADTLIVTTAIEVSSNSPTVVIIGEDVDLLVLLIGLGASKDNIYFLKPGRGNTVQSMYSSAAIEQRHVAENILFLHAISGCDTTSALFNMGKVKILNNFRKNEELQATIEVFKQPDSSPDAVATAGELFLLAVYGCNEETESTLNKCRYKHFLKSANSATFNLSALPPTSSAARQHSFRVYCQVQQWYGNSINPLHWGWKRSTTGLMPVLTTSDPAPLNLLSTITCQCKKGCRSTCGCRKAGLMCSVMCKHCNGNCDNVHIDIDDIDEMESLDDDELSTIFQ